MEKYFGVIGIINNSAYKLRLEVPKIRDGNILKKLLPQMLKLIIIS